MRNSPLYVIFDGGNTNIKAMRYGEYGHELLMPHAVRRLPPGEYANIVERFKTRRLNFEDTVIFSMDGNHYVIGQHAMRVGRPDRRKGPAKYERDHFGAMFAAAMQLFCPHDHPDVRVICLHPADLTSHNMKRMGKCIYGKHSVTDVTGRKITYNVTEVIPLEEPVAGFQSWMLTTEGRTYKEYEAFLTPGIRILIIDIGGGITSLVPVSINRAGQVEINMIDNPVIEYGIQQVVETFQAELKESADFHAAFANTTNIPLDMLHDGLANRAIKIKGDTHDCVALAYNAVAPLLGQVDGIYHAQFGGGISYDAIVMTGGGGGLAMQYLIDEVFNHSRVFSAEQMGRMQFSNIRGASKGLELFLAEGRNGR